ncbi:MAG: lysylphosphatidylglycerol synthase transmembrane domain-containing protein, partial [Bacteroidota bacterium]
MKQAQFIKWAKISLALLVLTLVAVFIVQVDFSLLLVKLRQLQWRFLLIALTPGLGYILATIAWRYCFPQQKKQLGIGRLFMIRHVGESLALINPTNIIAGESSKAILLKRIGVPYSDGIVSLILSRTLLILSHVFLLVVISLVVFYAIGQDIALGFQILLLVFCFLLGVVFFYALTNRQLWLYRGYLRLARVLQFLKKGAAKIKTINLEMSHFYHTQRDKLLLAFIFSALHWCVGALEFYLIFWFLEVPITYQYALFIELGVMVFKSLGSFVPGQIGVEEYGNLFMLHLLNFENAELWIAISLIRRGRQIF